MNRLNLSSTEARTRVKALINTKYREIATSVNMPKVRRSTATAATVSGNNAITFSNVANVIGVYDTVNLKRALTEATVADILQMDPNNEVTGFPHTYAVKNHGATSVTLILYPEPASVYNLTADVLAIGTTLTADGDIPAFPEDFHDVLVEGVVYPELLKLEKLALARDARDQFETRKSELRYYFAKRAFLSKRQTDQGLPLGFSKIWPYGVAP